MSLRQSPLLATLIIIGCTTDAPSAGTSPDGAAVEDFAAEGGEVEADHQAGFVVGPAFGEAAESEKGESER